MIDDIEEDAQQRYMEIVESVVEDGGSAKEQTDKVMRELGRDLANPTEILATQRYLDAAEETLVEIAKQTDSAATVIDRSEKVVREFVGGAVTVGIDRICESLHPRLEQLRYEQAEVTDARELEFSHGIPFDVFLEDHLQRVVKKQNRGKIIIEWHFDDSSVVKCRDGEYLSYTQFYRLTSSATSKTVRKDLISEELLSVCPGDPETDSEALRIFREMSIGSQGRPWSSKTWNEAITGLEHEYRTQK